jgi:hypothetical protein
MPRPPAKALPVTGARTDTAGQMINLMVVVDPNYGDRLAAAAQIAPVWVVATQINKAACNHLWSARPSVDHRDTGAVTCYEVGDTEDRFANLLNVLPTLEEHHGEIRDDRFSFPDGFVIEVVGLTPTDSVMTALRGSGFSSFIEIPNGFQARRCRTSDGES